VFLTYPLAVDDVEAVQGEVAADLDVPLVRCLPAFTAELQHRPRGELYIADGHCTDAGYALMAAASLGAVARELQH
jgi:lysophospholipase L1-like esterase